MSDCVKLLPLIGNLFQSRRFTFSKYPLETLRLLTQQLASLSKQTLDSTLNFFLYLYYFRSFMYRAVKLTNYSFSFVSFE